MTTASVVVPTSPNQRAWNRFTRNRLGLWSLWIFVALLVLSALAEVISNDKPLVARYEGELFFPILNNQPETRFGGDFHTQTDWSDPFIAQQFAKPGNWDAARTHPAFGELHRVLRKGRVPGPAQRPIIG
jgi:microcin C transport system permease protein